MTTTLRGVTWSHPRGYDPLVACSAFYEEQRGVEIVWDKRSLQDFEIYPVQELARDYDLTIAASQQISTGLAVREDEGTVVDDIHELYRNCKTGGFS